MQFKNGASLRYGDFSTYPALLTFTASITMYKTCCPSTVPFLALEHNLHPLILLKFRYHPWVVSFSSTLQFSATLGSSDKSLLLVRPGIQTPRYVLSAVSPWRQCRPAQRSCSRLVSKRPMLFDRPANDQPLWGWNSDPRSFSRRLSVCSTCPCCAVVVVVHVPAGVHGEALLGAVPSWR